MNLGGLRTLSSCAAMGMAVSMTGSWRRLIIRENVWKISAKQAEAAELHFNCLRHSAEKTDAKQAERNHFQADMSFVFSEELHFNSQLGSSGPETWLAKPCIV